MANSHEGTAVNELLYFKQECLAKMQEYLDKLEGNEPIVISTTHNTVEKNKSCKQPRIECIREQIKMMEEAVDIQSVLNILDDTNRKINNFDKVQDEMLSKFTTPVKVDEVYNNNPQGTSGASAGVMEDVIVNQRDFTLKDNPLSEGIAAHISSLSHILKVEDRIFMALTNELSKKTTSNTTGNTTASSNVLGELTLEQQKNININACLAAITKKDSPVGIKQFRNALDELRIANATALAASQKKHNTNPKEYMKRKKSEFSMWRFNTMLESEIKELDRIASHLVQKKDIKEKSLLERVRGH